MSGHAQAVWSFSGPSFEVGTTELRPLFHLALPTPMTAEIAHVVVMMLFLLVALTTVITIRRGIADCVTFHSAVLAICGTFVLMTTFHNAYDTVLMLPVLALVGPPWAAGHIRSDRIAWTVLQTLLVAQLPTLALRLQHDPGGDSQPLIQLLQHADRAMVLAAFGYAVWRARSKRSDRRAST